MTFRNGLAKPRVRLRYFCLAIALFAVGPITSQAGRTMGLAGQAFERGCWHFVRTLDLIAHRKNKHRVLEREATRCVDPTVSMKATFASASSETAFRQNRRSRTIRTLSPIAATIWGRSAPS